MTNLTVTLNHDAAAELDSSLLGEVGTSSTVLRRLVASGRGKLAIVLLGILLIIVVFGPTLAPDNPTIQNLAVVNLSPWLFGGTTAHLLGTDQYGRDILSRLLVGLRPSLLIGLGASTVGALIGLALGIVAGTSRRVFGPIILRFAELELALPFYIVAIAVVASIGPGLLQLFILLTLWGWPTYARTIANQVSRVRTLDFVSAARLAGSRPGQIMLRHVVPNVLAPTVVLWSGTIGYVIVAESALDFIGLGLKPPAFSLGTMLTDALTELGNSWAIVVFPGLLLALTIIAFNVLGDAVRDALNPEISAGKRPGRRRKRPAPNAEADPSLPAVTP
jgi:peptide/nickel transport system permease protein